MPLTKLRRAMGSKDGDRRKCDIARTCAVGGKVVAGEVKGVERRGVRRA